MKHKNILKLTKLLSDESIPKEKILNELNIKDSAFYQLTGNLKKAGFNVKKTKKGYEIMFFQNELEFDEFEKTLFAYLMSIGKISLSERRKKETFELSRKILSLSSKETSTVIFEKLDKFKNTLFNDVYGEKLKTWREYIKQKQILKVTTTNKREYILRPLEIEYENEKTRIIFLDIDLKETRRLSIETISKAVPRLNYKAPSKPPRETVFELYEHLAKSYRLKKNEKVISRDKNKLVIANSSSDKKILFQRLLRYDILCKVVASRKDVIDFQKLIDKSIRNIGN